VEILTLLKIGAEILKENKIESSQLEVEILLSFLLGIEGYKIYTEKIEVDKNFVNRFLKLIEKRKKGIPIQYITKKVNFFDSEFKIEKGVFIPRPETEILVEKTIQIYKENFYPKKVKILDIGTGCGNIAICLAKNIENCYVVGTDISKKAVKLAEENAILNNVENKVEFRYSNIFSDIDGIFEIIVSNPPYVSETEYEKLSKEVKNEPKKALIAGKDGLKIIKKILDDVSNFLKKNGFLIMEIGKGQKGKIERMNLKGIEISGFLDDYSGIKRVAIFKKL
jgi:protein-(glutamine-N5) methyltransferase, release factor-specific